MGHKHETEHAWIPTVRTERCVLETTQKNRYASRNVALVQHLIFKYSKKCSPVQSYICWKEKKYFLVGLSLLIFKSFFTYILRYIRSKIVYSNLYMCVREFQIDYSDSASIYAIKYLSFLYFKNLEYYIWLQSHQSGVCGLNLVRAPWRAKTGHKHETEHAWIRTVRTERCVLEMT